MPIPVTVQVLGYLMKHVAQLLCPTIAEHESETRTNYRYLLLSWSYGFYTDRERLVFRHSPSTPRLWALVVGGPRALFPMTGGLSLVPPTSAVTASHDGLLLRLRDGAGEPQIELPWVYLR